MISVNASKTLSVDQNDYFMKDTISNKLILEYNYNEKSSKRTSKERAVPPQE